MLIPKKNRREVYKYLFKGESLPPPLPLLLLVASRSRLHCLHDVPLPGKLQSSYNFTHLTAPYGTHT